MKAVIFGASGQDGQYLAQVCKDRGVDVVLCSRSPGSWIQADVADYSQVESVIRQYQPDYVFHLAANSTTRHDALFENHQTISTGTLNILELSQRHCPAARIFLTGSGLQFKNNGTPISEHDEFDASSSYAVARIQSTYAARYFRARGLKVYVGYLFHHESPLRKPSHVSKLIASAAARISKGSNEVLELGDIHVEKEWTFAGDVTEGIWCLVNQENVFESTIGSGVTYSIENWLAHCFSHVEKDWLDHVRIREGFVAEYNRLVSDPSTIFSLGWKPKVPIVDLAAMMVEAEVDIVTHKINP